MTATALETAIGAAWEARDGINPETKGETRDAVESALAMLDSGEARVAEKIAIGNWRVNQWLKKAVLLSFRLNDMHKIYTMFERFILNIHVFCSSHIYYK